MPLPCAAFQAQRTHLLPCPLRPPPQALDVTMFLKAAVTSGAMFETRFNSGEGREVAELVC